VSTNVYRSEQVTHYAPGEPATYYGWYISWSGGEDDSGYPFPTAERREDWLDAVRKRWPEFDEYECEYLAAFLALAAWGSESARDSMAFAVDDRYLNIGDWWELADSFDPSETSVRKGGA
jgi:hypothetical protein